MSDTGEVRVGAPAPWEHAHTCYTCDVWFQCSWLYCQDQRQRNCLSCIQAAQQGEEATP